MELLEAVEQFGTVRLLKASFFVYPVVNALHVMAIGALWTSVILMDFRILGTFDNVEQAPFVRLLRRLALIAFGGALLTGLAMFAVRASEYAAMPIFLAKMALIVLAGLNFVLFRFLGERDGEDASGSAKVMAVLSMVLWTGVLFAGRFIGFM